jgi:hypothetical protein
MASASVASITIRELATHAFQLFPSAVINADEDIRTRADADRALGIARNHVDIFAGSGDIVVPPG